MGMRIQFSSTGGIAHFPGLAKPLTIDSAQMQAADAKKLEQLIVAARFFELPAKVGSPQAGAADYRTYTITVESGEQRHTVEAVEPIEDVSLSELVAFLREKKKNP